MNGFECTASFQLDNHPVGNQEIRPKFTNLLAAEPNGQGLLLRDSDALRCERAEHGALIN